MVRQVATRIEFATPLAWPRPARTSLAAVAGSTTFVRLRWEPLRAQRVAELLKKVLEVWFPGGGSDASRRGRSAGELAHLTVPA